MLAVACCSKRVPTNILILLIDINVVSVGPWVPAGSWASGGAALLKALCLLLVTHSVGANLGFPFSGHVAMSSRTTVK